MKPVFADTHYFLALLNPGDDAHARAAEWTRKSRRPAITTRWVLAEFANVMSQPQNRGRVLTVLAMLRNRGDFEIVLDSDRLFDGGLARYEQRADKGWSLTDCISFVLMEERGISEALTADHHFEQAGFVRLLG